MDTFRVRLNCIDHYQAVPLAEFDPPVPHDVATHQPNDRPRVSVIRVFGATETGQKVLMHIHGALQYTYIEYSGSLLPEHVDVARRTLQLAIDHALAVSYRKNIYEGKHRYVAHISLVKGVPFYGFHVGYKFYLKIYLLNPLHMTRLADLLREGAVMKRVLQPYESHMQYLAQWMCDYNLYGCGYIDCRRVKFRAPIPNYFDMTNPMHHWHDRSIPPESISHPDLLPKQSHCTLEVDIHVKDILNRRDVEARALHHDFVERTHPIPADAKLVQSMAGLWKDETRRRKIRMGLKDSHSSPFPPEVLISMSADPRTKSAAGWIHEEEYRAKIAQLVAEERDKGESREVSFDTFAAPTSQEARAKVQTALESVQDLYPASVPNLAPGDMDGSPLADGHGANGNDQVVVDGHGANGNDQVVVGEARAENIPNGADPSLQASDESPDNLDLKSSEMIDEQPSGPTSSAEFKRYGIHLPGHSKCLAEEVFEVPAKHPTGPADRVKETKRVRLSTPPSFKARKRRRMLVDDQNLLPDIPSSSEDDADVNFGANDARPFPSSGQELIPTDSSNEGPNVPSLSQQSTLSFTSVKNPNDLNTLLRLSQKSDHSPKPSPSHPARPSASSAVSQHPAKSRATASQHTLVPLHLQGSHNSAETRGVTIHGLNKPSHGSCLQIYRPRPLSFHDVSATMSQQGVPDALYQEAFYSHEADVPGLARQYAGREFKLQSATVPYLPDFDPSGTSLATLGRKPPVLIDFAAEKVRENQRRKRCTISHWAMCEPPPRKMDVLSWLDEQPASEMTSVSAKPMAPAKPLSQIDGPTQKNPYGFKYSQKLPSTSVQHETQYMSIMSLEVHVNTRGSLAPNPNEDAIASIFWCVQSDDDKVDWTGGEDCLHQGILAVADTPHMARRISRNVAFEVEEEATELDALTRLIDIVRRFDPDILTGYEVHNSSWGYLIERARVKYDLNLCDELSRMKSQSHGRFGKDDDRWGFNHTSTIRVTGRHTINIWRAMRGELNLLQYTMENVVFHLLHQRIPHYSFADLTKWYQSKNPRDLGKVIEYFSRRVELDIRILDANELVPRTSEQARLLGVDWFSVISRGSQFKVESLMFRIAKPENLLLVSPSRRQVGGQNALECLPLVMEPRSDFYTSPLLVLDFQSLYPSVMIAYNYCYSTFLGRVVNWRGTNKMGFSDYRREPRLLELLKDHINIAPNGIMYAKTEVRKSLLAKMLGEILETRVMVKSGMKVDKDDKTLQRLLNNRQLALKLIANVTYGYTSASFSGRMPCSEIADSIVQTGRETLEKAIALIHSVERWGAEVVYGDTDSLFVYLKGRTRDQAFDIGEEIADTITKMNPRPVKLKFEKVYHPCVLLAKKRYVGFKYESRHQTEPEFDAKGIETVRRDGTPAEQKIEETALKLLFRTSDLSQVKSFFQAQCAKIMRGSVSIQDFCFAREVKLGTYSDKGPPPPGALISARKMLEDPRLEPQYGERVPYVVVTGGPGARLIDRCVAPEVLLNDAQSELDAEYYISKNIIPPLERIFNLVGANVRQWYDEMPRYQRIRRVHAKQPGMLKRTLESYMKSSICLVCRKALDTDSELCTRCLRQSSRSLLDLRTRLVKVEKKAAQMAAVCRSCSGVAWNDEVRCDSKDCPVFYSRGRHDAALANEEAQLLPVIKTLEDLDNSLAW